MSSEKLSSSAQRVQNALTASGIELHVHELDSSTRTAQDAADSIDCSVGQIAKSLVLRGQESDDAILIMVSGSNQLSVQHAVRYVGEALVKADADFVRKQTGFAIGGVPPVGHTERLRTFVDKDLLEYSEIWAAAGTPNAVFALTPDQLLQLTNSIVISVE